MIFPNIDSVSNFIVLALWFSVLTGLIESNEYRINEGASTSGLQDEVNDGEKCNIRGFIHNTLNLLTIIRNETRPNIDVAIRESQSVYFYAIGQYLRYGIVSNAPDSNQPVLRNYKERKRYYDLYIKQEALEYFMQSCKRYIRDVIRETLDAFSNIVLQTLPAPNTIVHMNHANIKNKSGTAHTLVTSDNHVIPLALIFRFFEEWSESFIMIPRNLFECTNAAAYYQISAAFRVANPYGRIGNFPDNCSNPNDLRRNLISSAFRGNIFRTPEPYIREPYLSSHDRTSLQLLLEFDFDSELILEPERYQELLSLFNRLIDYLRIDPEGITPFERYTSGVELYVSMMTTFLSYEPFLVGLTQLERRKMLEEELSELDKWERDYFKDKLFWVMKRKRSKEFRRSIIQNEEELLINPESNQWWTKFVTYLMSSFLQSQFSKKFIPWSASFARLYYFDYKSKSSLNCLNRHFDTFLHSKISQLQEWQDCIGSNELKISNKWCQAWRNVISRFSSTNNLIRKESTEFHYDLEVVVDWLRDKVSTNNQERTEMYYGFIMHVENSNKSQLSPEEQSSLIKIVRGVMTEQQFPQKKNLTCFLINQQLEV